MKDKLLTRNDLQNILAHLQMSPEKLGIHVSTEVPTDEDGDNGDLWIVYIPPETTETTTETE